MRREGRKEGRQEGRQEGRKEGRQEGRKEGAAQGLATALLTVLKARRIPVPSAARKRILEEKRPARLERWLARESVGTTLSSVLGDSR